MSPKYALAFTAEKLIPSWSHDGKRLAVLRWGNNRTSIGLYNADGSNGTQLALPGSFDRRIAQSAIPGQIK